MPTSSFVSCVDEESKPMSRQVSFDDEDLTSTKRRDSFGDAMSRQVSFDDDEDEDVKPMRRQVSFEDEYPITPVTPFKLSGEEGSCETSGFERQISVASVSTTASFATTSTAKDGPMMSLQSSPLRRRRAALGITVSCSPAVGPFSDPQCKGLSDDYEGFAKLGEGSTGVVYKVRRRTDGKDLAIKVMRMDDEERLNIARKEYTLLKQVSHPNIVKALDFFTFPMGAVLVLEHFDGKELAIIVREAPCRRLQESSARHLAAQLFGAISHMHSRNVIHRDIKAENVLVSSDLIDLRVLDFSAAKAVTESEPLTATGTERYMSPEALAGGSLSEVSDIWAAGLCLYLMIAGRLPSARLVSQAAFSPTDCKGSLVSLCDEEWVKISEPCKDVVRGCLELSYEFRPTAAAVLAKPWLAADQQGLPDAEDCCAVTSNEWYAWLSTGYPLPTGGD